MLLKEHYYRIIYVNMDKIMINSIQFNSIQQHGLMSYESIKYFMQMQLRPTCHVFHVRQLLRCNSYDISTALTLHSAVS